MRRKTRPRVVWLPPTNANSVSADNRSGIQTFIVDVDSSLSPFRTTGEIPLVIDAESDPLAATTSLSDVENSGYRLRRIVGKIFAFQRQVGGQADPTPQQMLVTAGLIVRRINPETGASLASSVGTSGVIVDTQDIENYGDPWIWRRTWMLFDNTSSDPSIFGDGPTSNVEYGSVADGAHVDAKTARIVGPEERLFLDVTVQLVELGNGTLASSTFITADLRCLASMRTSSGNRRNASR